MIIGLSVPAFTIIHVVITLIAIVSGFVVSGAGVRHGSSAKPVETTQIAPTILNLLGLDPNALQAVQIEGTQVLPGTARH